MLGALPIFNMPVPLFQLRPAHAPALFVRASPPCFLLVLDDFHEARIARQGALAS